MAKHLVCTDSDSRIKPRMPVEVNQWTQGIYALLSNGVNVALTLTKYDGSTYTYELRDDDV